MKMMRVLLLSHSGGVGGATRSLQVVARDLTKLGAEVSLLAPAGAMHNEWKEDGLAPNEWKPPYCPWLCGAIYSSGLVKFRWVMLALLGILPLRLYRCYKLLLEKIINERPDFIHINSLTLFPLIVLIPRLKKNTNVDFKVVWHLREMLNPLLFSPIKNLIVKGITKHSYKVIAITENEANLFKEANIVIIYNTIPISWEITDVDSKSKKSDNNDSFKVVMASALSPAKGLKEYFEVAKRVRKKYPNVEFDLYTPRSPAAVESSLKSFPETKRYMDIAFKDISQLVISEGVTWKMGFKITNELYESYDLYIRPDRAGCPWGRDIIEALWIGLPVIATGDYDGFVKDGENGFLVKVGDVKQMTERVIQCIESPNLKQKLRKNAKNFSADNFSPAVHREKLARVFDFV